MRLISIHQIPQLSSLWAAVTPHTSQIITAGSKTVQKDASLTVIAVLTIFALNLVEVGQSTHTCRFLMIRIGIAGGVLMSPNAMVSSSLW
jgi:hypothetical protein